MFKQFAKRLEEKKLSEAVGGSTRTRSTTAAGVHGLAAAHEAV
jgi:hypothetical protein